MIPTTLFALVSLAQQEPPPHRVSLADVQRQITLIEQRLKAGETWTTLRGKYVTFNYVAAPGVTSALAGGERDICDKAVEEDCAILGIDLPTEPIPVYFYPNETDLGKALQSAKPVSGGVSIGNWSAIPDPLSLKDLHVLACHELGHALVHESWGLYGCQFFSEGLSYYLEARARNDPWLAKPKLNDDLPAKGLWLKGLAEKANNPSAYQNGAAFVAYLLSLDAGKPARLQAVYMEMSKARIRQLQGFGNEPWGDRVEQAFAKVYGEDLDHLEADWRAR